MDKLMKPAEYAKELGISRQAVYAKIKRGILTAKNVEGKLYILVDKEEEQTQTPASTKIASKKKSTHSETPIQNKNYEALLQSKDETISVLKGTVKELKKSNKQISTTLKGEIDLLKEAFYEMRSLYAKQLEYKKPQDQDTIDVYTEDEQTVNWIGLKKFLKQADIGKEKRQEKVRKRIKKAYKKGDGRFTKIKGKLKLDADKNYEDILK